MLVICNGMSRSGSTYQYNLARCLVERAGAGKAHAYIAPEDADVRLSVSDDRFRSWVTSRAVHVVKTHRVHPLLPELIGTGRIKVLYIHRDIRDVAVSTKRVWGMRGQKLIESLDKIVLAYWGLKELRQVAPEHFLWQRYDHLMSDPETAAGEIRDFLSVDVSEDDFRASVDECSLKTVKAHCDRVEQGMRAQGLERQSRARRACCTDTLECGAGARSVLEFAALFAFAAQRIRRGVLADTPSAGAHAAYRAV